MDDCPIKISMYVVNWKLPWLITGGYITRTFSFVGPASMGLALVDPVCSIAEGVPAELPSTRGVSKTTPVFCFFLLFC